MSAPRAREVLEAFRAAEELAAADPGAVRAALAVLVALDGAAADRSGAALVAAEDNAAGVPGAVAAAGLPAGLREAAEAVLAGGPARLCVAALSEDDALFGPGGFRGEAEAWLVPVDSALREDLRAWREALLRGEGLVLEWTVAGPRAGARRALPAGSAEARECLDSLEPELVETASSSGVERVLRVPLSPMGKVLILGSGEDARLLAERLDALGFSVAVADPRPGRLRGPGWDRARWELVEGGWEEARRAFHPDEGAFVVCALHSEELDREALRGALQSPARLVALAGPAARAARLLAGLREEGVEPRPGALSAPAGLDLGAQTPGEWALAAAAEILAVRGDRRGGRHPRPRAAPSHAPRREGARVPGLILAAGRGRRFGASSKLLAGVGGRPVLRHVVESALAARLDPVIVILGAGAEAGLKAIEGLDDPRLRVVFNPAWRSGKASSFEVALREVPPEAPGVLALLGDMPRVPPWLIERVLSEFELSGRLTFPVAPGPGGPVKGHPTAYPRALFGEVRELVGDDTAMEAVRRHWSEAVRVPLEDASTQADVDTAADLDLLNAPS